MKDDTFEQVITKHFTKNAKSFDTLKVFLGIKLKHLLLFHNRFSYYYHNFGQQSLNVRLQCYNFLNFFIISYYCINADSVVILVMSIALSTM